MWGRGFRCGVAGWKAMDWRGCFIWFGGDERGILDGDRNRDRECGGRGRRAVERRGEERRGEKRRGEEKRGEGCGGRAFCRGVGAAFVVAAFVVVRDGGLEEREGGMEE